MFMITQIHYATLDEMIEYHMNRQHARQLKIQDKMYAVT